jgi:hypothetical protein
MVETKKAAALGGVVAANPSERFSPVLTNLETTQPATRVWFECGFHSGKQEKGYE